MLITNLTFGMHSEALTYRFASQGVVTKTERNNTCQIGLNNFVGECGTSLIRTADSDLTPAVIGTKTHYVRR